LWRIIKIYFLIMNRLLITGASGFLGYTLCAIARPRWRVWGVVHSHPVKVPGVEIVPADLTDPAAVAALFAKVRPDAVIHCAALSRPNDCQSDPAMSRKVNIDATVSMAQNCARASIPLVFTSSDLVFDGEHAPYAEDRPTAPINVYGEHKAEAERRILDICAKAAVCRMPLMFGDPSPASESFLQPMIRALAAGTSIPVFTDEVRSAVSAPTAASGLLLALDKGYAGILHLGGRERASRFDLAAIVAGLTKSDPALLTPMHQKDARSIAPRPRDVTLDSARAYSLGYNPLTLAEEMARLKCCGGAG
jgi:dTDP-4-dehydrorhamnose reductase